MANPQVLTQIGHADPNASPLNINELIDLLNTLINSSIYPPDSFLPYVVQQGEPGVDDRDKVWFRIDSQGRPIEIKLWYIGAAGGRWRRVYNGMPGEIRGYSGNPGLNTTGDFDANGHGNVGGNYDGWQICNGKNGSPNMSDKFLLGAHMDNSSGNTGYSNGWKAVIDSKSYGPTGGQWTETLKPENIPWPAQQAVGADKWAADGNARSSSGQLFGVHDVSLDVTFIPADPGNPSPVPVFTGPPFYVLAWIIFQGYA
jgi:hypothetical protein